MKDGATSTIGIARAARLTTARRWRFCGAGRVATGAVTIEVRLVATGTTACVTVCGSRTACLTTCLPGTGSGARAARPEADRGSDPPRRPLEAQGDPPPRSAAEGAEGARSPAVGRSSRPPPSMSMPLPAQRNTRALPWQRSGGAAGGRPSLRINESRCLAHTLSRASAVHGVAARAVPVRLGQLTSGAGAPDGGAGCVVRRTHLCCSRRTPASCAVPAH